MIPCVRKHFSRTELVSDVSCASGGTFYARGFIFGVPPTFALKVTIRLRELRIGLGAYNGYLMTVVVADEDILYLSFMV